MPLIIPGGVRSTIGSRTFFYSGHCPFPGGSMRSPLATAYRVRRRHWRIKFHEMFDEVMKCRKRCS
jgi:hypothetical protein